MPYRDFAWVYDVLNENADYDALARYIIAQLHSFGIEDGTIADLGCGTGDLTLRLAQAGYDMLGVDASEDMLSILQNKAWESGCDNIFLVHQKLESLRLYGTVRAAVSSFDTFNHIGPYAKLQKAIFKAAQYIEKGGVLLFDMNTPYKHEEVLADNTFELQTEEVECIWKNHFDAENARTRITVQIQTDREAFTERFYEYMYTLTQIQQACEAAGMTVRSVCDGEAFAPLRGDTQRYFITAIKE